MKLKFSVLSFFWEGPNRCSGGSTTQQMMVGQPGGGRVSAGNAAACRAEDYKGHPAVLRALGLYMEKLGTKWDGDGA